MFRGYLYKEYPKRFKTIVRKLDEFIDYLYENYDFTLLDFGDGVGLIYKKSQFFKSIKYAYLKAKKPRKISRFLFLLKKFTLNI